jgi:hypothetical protein
MIRSEIEVKVGQVWEDRQSPGRMLTVEGLCEKRDPWNELWPAARLRAGAQFRSVVIQERNLRKRFNLVREADGTEVAR